MLVDIMFADTTSGCNLRSPAWGICHATVAGCLALQSCTAALHSSLAQLSRTVFLS